MKLDYNEDGGYFLATSITTKDQTFFLIQQKGDYVTTSTYLTTKDAKQLRDELDFWLKQRGQAEGTE